MDDKELVKIVCGDKTWWSVYEGFSGNSYKKATHYTSEKDALDRMGEIDDGNTKT